MTFVDPIGAGFRQGRVDAGVDYLGSGPLYALGSGTITSISNSGWPGSHAFIAIKLDDTSGLSDYVYYAEDINPSVQVGERVSAGQQIGTATGGSTGIEVGWAKAPGIGSALGGPPFPSSAGTNFFNLVKSLGGIGGSGSSGDVTNNTVTNNGTGVNLGTAAVQGVANIFGVKSFKDVAIRAGLLLLGALLLYHGLKTGFSSPPSFSRKPSATKAGASSGSQPASSDEKKASPESDQEGEADNES